MDPIPEVRSVAARAIGSLIRGMGEENFPDLVPWLLDTLKSDGSNVERSGAAQGLSEVSLWTSDYCVLSFWNSVVLGSFLVLGGEFNIISSATCLNELLDFAFIRKSRLYLQNNTCINLWWAFKVSYGCRDNTRSTNVSRLHY